MRIDRDSSGRLIVYDPLRHKWLCLTPEEWVRQHVVAHLIADLGYPPHLMANEVGLRVNGRLRRCDSIVWRVGGATPLMVIEFKAPDVELNQTVFDQIGRYNLTLGASALLVSNGLSHYCFTSDGRFFDRIPDYRTLLEI